MSYREIKAFIHRNRVADVVDALYDANFRTLTVIDVEGLLKALDPSEQRYSVEIGRKVITQVKLELVCKNDDRVAQAVDLIKTHARTGQPTAGWIYVSDIRTAIEITD